MQRVILFLALLVAALLPSTATAGVRVHPYECKTCHNAALFQAGLGNPLGNNVCFQCHQTGTGDTVPFFPGAYPAPLDGIVEAVFSAGDASHRFGFGNGNPATDRQSSHNWSAPVTNPAAGSAQPSRATREGAAFHSRYGTTIASVTCARCHDPHGWLYDEQYAYLANPKLLRLGSRDDKYPFSPYNSAYPNAPTDQAAAAAFNLAQGDLMCRTCHKAWVLDDRGWLTHPIVDDYAASAAAQPDKYRATLANTGNAGIRLVDGGVSCSSCHNAHHADSDASTTDGPGQALSQSTGRLLRGDGLERADKSSLCQSCHTYGAHGGSAETVGCLVCHSGHTYDPTAPNYFVLRKSAETTLFGQVNNLDYSSPDVLVPAEKYKFWNDRTDGTADGYCEKCHGDARDIGLGAGNYHVAAAVCTNCHQHDNSSGAFAAACDTCHGFPPGPLAAAPDDTGSTTAGAHTEHVNTQKIGCDACHASSVGSGPTHNNGNHKITLGFAPFGAQQQGGSYDGQTTALYDATATTPATSVTNTGTKQCSNLYCHGNYPGSGTNATPTWDDAASTPCGSCHGASNTTEPTSGSHGRHAGLGFWTGPNGPQYEREYACSLCHEDVVDGVGPAGYSIQSVVKHVDGRVDLKFDTADDRISGSESYSVLPGTQSPTDGDTGAGRRAFGTCVNLYCHSNVQPEGGIGGPDLYTEPVWGTVSDCQGCHVGAGGTALIRHRSIASGSHGSHLNSSGGNPIDCFRCHNWTGTATGTSSGCSSGLCHGDVNEKALHANGIIDIIFGTSFGTTAQYDDADNRPGDGYSTCSNVYCHSVGTARRTGETEFTNTTPTWGGATECNSCHGTTSGYAPPDWRSGTPTYANGTPKENSHVQHIAQAEIDNCSFCHADVTLDGRNFTQPNQHGDFFYRVTFEDVSHGDGGRNRLANRDVQFVYWPENTVKSPTIQSPSGRCSNITCHGYPNWAFMAEAKPYVPVKSSTYWGEKLSCGDCHLHQPGTGAIGGGDVDSYEYGDGLHAAIDNDQWLYSGHGKTAGVYDISGNPAANFEGAANCIEWADSFPDAVKFPSDEVRCDPCFYCHDDSVAHNDAGNPFRLKDHGGANGWNDVCLVCHRTGATGYDPDAASGMANKAATVKIDKYHSGNLHGAANDGGSLCWDCHDPHGDRIAGDGNIFMIHKQVTVDKADAFGTPATTASPVFINNAAEADFARSSAPYNGICNVCHTGTGHYTSSSGDNHYEPGTQACTACHFHSGNTTVNGGAFDHAGGLGCENCHGHDAGTNFDPDLSLPYNAGATPSQGKGTVQSHSTHTETTGDDLKGPGIYCNSCHDINNFPFFKSGTDGNGDGKFNLAETDVCNPCHSSGGAFDGLNDATLGAKSNWKSGVYTGAALTVGKEKWCASCHDTGTSVIGGRQAPDVAGDNSNYGFYVSGHGGALQECGDCHGLEMSHNFDGQKTYTVAANNYKAAYRLMDVGGSSPMNIPYVLQNECDYNQAPTDFELCFKCHSEQKLLNDTRAVGYLGCTSNPYDNAAAITTSFRDVLGGENIHADHLIGVSAWFFSLWPTAKWDSDGNGSLDSAVSCSTCHNPHGPARANGITPTKMMTIPELDILWGTDGTGDYGQVGPAGNVDNVCFNCHAANGGKYYRTHPVPELDSITVADNNATDPAAAEAGFTNSATVTITFNLGPFTPVQMNIAQDFDFTDNATGWIAYSSPYTYTLSAGEGPVTVYAQVRDGATTSGVRGDTITLDTTNPVVSASALSSPNGTETLIQDVANDITWAPGQITDVNLKTTPVTLHYSTDSGATFPNIISENELNDGTYSWSVAPVESSTVRVRLTATDRAGNQAVDTSDNDFTIEPAGAAALSGITVTDNNSSDPSEAEAGFTNNPAVTATLSASNNPTQMILAEDPGFSVNATGWIAFNANSTYTLSSGDGSKTIYAKVRNTLGESGSQNSSIILDTASPAILSATLTAPNGNADPLLAEYWTIGSTRTITWNSGEITDANLKSAPVTLKFSTNSGVSYTTTLAAGEANDGSYTWSPLPSTVRFNARVQLVATDKAGNQSTDVSDNDFKISPPDKFIITDPGDTSTLGTLRYALNNLEDNAVLWFRLTAPVNQVTEIIIGSDLPDIANSGVTIDGDSQAQLVGNNNPNGPEVRIKGPGAASTADALVFTADDGWVENLQIGGFRYAMSASAANVVALGCQFGFGSDATGYSTAAALRNAQAVRLTGTSSYAYVGAGGSNRNFIACSTDIGLNNGGSNNEIGDNVFGILPDFATQCANTNRSIELAGSSASSVQRNIICGSTYGMHVQNTSGLRAQGNQIGAFYNGTGWVDCTDPSYAIYFDTGAGNTDNVIGGANVATADNNLRDSNVIDPGNNVFGGIRIRGTASTGIPTKIYGNFFGTNPARTQTFAGTHAIYINESSSGPAYIGGYNAGEAGNVIANMSTYGIFVDSAATPADYIGINRNSFYNNGDNALDDAIFIGSGDNGNITRPLIDSATTTQVTVSGVSNGNVVEVYLADFGGTEFGEGKTLVGSATASGATVVVPVSGVSSSDWVTATRTGISGVQRSTSAFSTNIQVP